MLGSSSPVRPPTILVRAPTVASSGAAAGTNPPVDNLAVACVSLKSDAGVRLMFGPPDFAIVLRQALEAMGPVATNPGNDDAAEWLRPYGLVSVSFKLPTKVWTSSNTDSAGDSRWRAATLVHSLAAEGWSLKASISLPCSTVSFDNLFFVRAEPNILPVMTLHLRHSGKIIAASAQPVSHTTIVRIRNTILSSWPLGIASERSLDLCTRSFKLVMPTRTLSTADPAQSRIMTMCLMRTMHDLGYRLLGPSAVDPWSQVNTNNGDTLFFQKRPLSEVINGDLAADYAPPAYDDLFGAQAGAVSGSGSSVSLSVATMLAPPSRRSSVSSDTPSTAARDLSSLSCILLDASHSVTIVSPTAYNMLIHITRKTIARAWPQGTDAERPHLTFGFPITEFKLKGDPFSTHYGTILVLQLLSHAALAGWRLSEAIKDKATDELPMLVLTLSPSSSPLSPTFPSLPTSPILPTSPTLLSMLTSPTSQMSPTSSMPPVSSTSSTSSTPPTSPTAPSASQPETSVVHFAIAFAAGHSRLRLITVSDPETSSAESLMPPSDLASLKSIINLTAFQVSGHVCPVTVSTGLAEWTLSHAQHRDSLSVDTLRKCRFLAALLMHRFEAAGWKFLAAPHLIKSNADIQTDTLVFGRQ
ncbi:hypothetical protein BC831DRAFT_472147 [Entophlyctis helioformis]|nr:hypothetical protein BC831DRAFT_472147 [Entophlyctis helioformis]